MSELLVSIDTFSDSLRMPARIPAFFVPSQETPSHCSRVLQASSVSSLFRMNASAPGLSRKSGSYFPHFLPRLPSPKAWSRRLILFTEYSCYRHPSFFHSQSSPPTHRSRLPTAHRTPPALTFSLFVGLHYAFTKRPSVSVRGFPQFDLWPCYPRRIYRVLLSLPPWTFLTCTNFDAFALLMCCCNHGVLPNIFFCVQGSDDGASSLTATTLGRRPILEGSALSLRRSSLLTFASFFCVTRVSVSSSFEETRHPPRHFHIIPFDNPRATLCPRHT